MQRLPIAQKIRPRDSSSDTFFNPDALPNRCASQKGKRVWAPVSMNWASAGTTNSTRSSSTCRRSPSTLCPLPMDEFGEFVTSGAYDDPRHWRPEDWRWKNLENKRHPSCWVEQADGWFYRSMFDVLPLGQVASWPVYVSLAEARAYAAWRGKRLPSEAEYQRAAFYGPDERETPYPWGDDAPGRRMATSILPRGRRLRSDRVQRGRAVGVFMNSSAMAGN